MDGMMGKPCQKCGKKLDVLDFPKEIKVRHFCYAPDAPFYLCRDCFHDVFYGWSHAEKTERDAEAAKYERIKGELNGERRKV